MRVVEEKHGFYIQKFVDGVWCRGYKIDKDFTLTLLEDTYEHAASMFEFLKARQHGLTWIPDKENISENI